MKPGDVVYLVMCNSEIHSIHMTFDGANKALQTNLEYWENSPLTVRVFDGGASFEVIKNGPVHHVLRHYYVLTRTLED